MTRSRLVVGGVATALAAAAGAGLVVLNEPAPGEPAASFHRAVGGLGLGPAFDLAGCELAFDPRICPQCSWDAGPVPGGRALCPHHALTVVPHPGVADAPAR